MAHPWPTYSSPDAPGPLDELRAEPDLVLRLVDAGLEITTSRGPQPGPIPCFPFLGSAQTAAQVVSYRRILKATVTDDKLCINHALPLSKDRLSACTETYTLAPKFDQGTAERWVEKLLARAYPNGQTQNRIKVLVNPHGGQGLAQRLWSQEAEPILRAAGCSLDVVVTTYRGHATEIARTLDVSAYDAVLCVSGDGLPHEVFNGLAQQDRPRRALRQTPVALIPGGSGNAMSLNLNGTNSPSLAALAILKAVRAPMDLVAVSQGDKRYFSFLSQSVGIVADCDLGTDNLRWLGPARFTLGFLLKILGKTLYPAEVSVKVEIADKADVRAAYKADRAKGTSPFADQEQEGDELPILQYGAVQDPLPADWETTDMPTLGNFYCGNAVFMSPDAPFFPAALPNDGKMDLVTIRGDIRRTASLRLMLSIEDNKFFNEPEVTYRKVSAYRITPRLRPGQTEGYISMDGEQVDFAPFQAEIVPGLATVLVQPGRFYHFDGPPEGRKG